MAEFTLKEQIEFMKRFESIAEHALELGIPTDWNGEDTLKVSKIRKFLEKINSGGRPRTAPKFETEAERRKYYRQLEKEKKEK